MKTHIIHFRKVEFEARIFISLGIVVCICLVSFIAFRGVTSNMLILGGLFGLEEQLSAKAGYFMIAGIMVVASCLRMWAGSVLSSGRVMSFRVVSDRLSARGPYAFTRNPIYLADLLAFCGFAFCLTPAGIAMPILLYLHYIQLIAYEELNFEQQFGEKFRKYREEIPRLFPSPVESQRIFSSLKSFFISTDGFRHNALYLLFIPGFIVSAFTGNLMHAIIIGLPAVIDWAVIHTRIGLRPGETESHNAIAAKESTRLKKSKVFSDILYAQCWEDPEIDRKAFRAGKEDVIFSITSGGCNVLAFLADDPKKIIALDLSPYQNYLLDLKMAAIREFDYEEILEFMGILSSERRVEMYQGLRKHLMNESVQYWDGQEEKILNGIIHCGRYEKYMHFLSKGMRLLVGRTLPEEVFSCREIDDRKSLYDRKWNNLRWRFFTRIFLSRSMMTLLFTGKFFDQLDESFSFGDHFRNNIKRAVTILPLKENYFFSYILFGKYYNLLNLPSWLQKENFDKIKSGIGRIEIITGSCEDYFRGLPAGSISKFNFSNIFEWMDPPSFENLLKETIRVATDGAVLTYRNLLVRRSRPECLSAWILPQHELSEELHAIDRSFIYRAFIVEKITKEP
jgi:S-adenosylmethionine-diacylglycerol 3-amino-3-carboxypropyl transferase